MNSRSNQVCMALVCIISFHSIFAARIVPGNSPLVTESFTFPLGPQVRNMTGSMLFVGALNQGTGKEFALSLWGSASDQFKPWSPQKATINGVPDQVNPLYDAAIARLGMFGLFDQEGRLLTFPIVVTGAAPADLNLVRGIFNVPVDNAQEPRADMLAINGIKDATGIETTREIIAVESLKNESIFAAVKPFNSNNFGQPNSGIAVAQLVTVKVDDCPQAALAQINAQPGSVAPEPLASALDITSLSIKIGNDVVSIENAVDLHYSERLQRLYIALQVQGNNMAATDGARGVVVGRLIEKKLIFAPIAPDAVFTLQDKIVGGTGINTQVSIHKVRTMYTSTGLDYLIVVGNVGAPGVTQNQVYALPLVNTNPPVPDSVQDIAAQGTLADVTASPVNFYSGDAVAACLALPNLLAVRAFVEPATLPNEVFTDASVQAFVGITALPEGNITDINVVNDVVFVSVADAAVNKNPGIFYSQALFDESGAVAAWTPWQRVAGTTDKVFGFSYKAAFGSFAWLTGPTNLSVNTVKESVWGLGTVGELANLVTVLGELFPVASAGVQGFFDLPLNTPGLFDISMYIATGLKKVALIQSGSIIAGTYTPTVGDFQTDLQEFTTGEITQNLPVGNSRVVAISGGVLDAIGPIVASAIGVNSVTNNGYLFVGGAYGLAVLAQPNGTGWSTLNALSTNLAGLAAGMRFATLGNYCFVRKLIFDEGFLYVLTDTQLDRIDVAASDFATGTLSVVTVATLADIGCVDNGTLFDAAVSHSFALLASSNGLYRVGNGVDIQTVPDNFSVGWTDVVVPEGMPVVQQLQPIASNSLPNGFAKTANGNVYILDAYAGLDIAQENRYTVQSVVGQPISSSTIAPLPDMKVKNILTSFYSFNQYVHLINFDGTDNFSARDRRFITTTILRKKLFTAAPFVYDRGVPVPLGIEDASSVSAIIRSSASGAWLISGDFGLRVNE